MDPLARLQTGKLHPVDRNTAQRQRATEVAGQFEEVFVRTLVQGMRQTASIGGDSGIFGSGPGADTYADWFDQNLATQLGKGGGIGIATTVLHDMERHREIDPAPRSAPRANATFADRLRNSAAAAAPAATAPAIGIGGDHGTR